MGVPMQYEVLGALRPTVGNTVGLSTRCSVATILVATDVAARGLGLAFFRTLIRHNICIN